KSGAWNSQLRACAQSRRGTGAELRSGYVNAYWIGMRMSVAEIWAITLPSLYSTMACTEDCGCTTTSTSDGFRSNSQQASITSKPLFINVAESMVMRLPIFHVG